MRGKASPSRKIVYKALERIRKDESFANEVIDKMIDTSKLSLIDRAFATKIVLGVVSTAGSLDEVIDRFAKRPKDIKGKLRTALRICAYEVIYLKKDAYAAVDQCVELVKEVQPYAAAFANALMRKVAQSMEDFPYGDPSTDIGAYSLEHGFPEWLVELTRSVLGPSASDDFVRACNLAAPVYVHLNALSSDKGSYDLLADIDPDIASVRIDGTLVEGCFKLSSSKTIADRRFLKMIEEGRLLISDAAPQLISQLAVEAAIASSNRTGLSCLELCAGRATKSILLQSMLASMEGSRFARYVACDNIDFKTRLLKERVSAYGAKVDEAICADARDIAASINSEQFDLVFLDAPCSGLGTMRRHPEIRWRISADVISSNAELDASLIRAAASHVAPGGVLAYSTCTISPEENELVVESFCESGEGGEFEPMEVMGSRYLRTMLHEDGYDAHFCAMLRRKAVI